MKPEVIMHNSISLDGRVTGFEANMALHYGIVNKYGADFYMAGSNTAKTGVELFGEMPVENEADYCKPEKGQDLSYWVIPDTKGSLKGMLHTFRRYEYCKDVILLISRQTNQDYIDYLEERHYDYLTCGDKFVDYKEAFKSLGTKYNARRILVDTGPTLSGILLKQRLVDKISLLIHPFLVGNNFPNIFEKLDLDKLNIGLKLEKQGTLENDYLQMVWQVIKDK
ncbi:MAG: RibD family protein [Candidatus Omnitrophica bacterium]|nr:RibD family protein [Candidatus Omnitrophota bacterium]